jgi:hypothetical protein
MTRDRDVVSPAAPTLRHDTRWRRAYNKRRHRMQGGEPDIFGLSPAATPRESALTQQDAEETISAQAAQKDPDARRRTAGRGTQSAGSRRTGSTSQRAPRYANAADEPFSAAWQMGRFQQLATGQDRRSLRPCTRPLGWYALRVAPSESRFPGGSQIAGRWRPGYCRSPRRPSGWQS